jgi:hypothetical protein
VQRVVGLVGLQGVLAGFQRVEVEAIHERLTWKTPHPDHLAETAALC